MLTIPTLSFCITCKNRFHQISKTLRKNLDDNKMFKNLIQFVLVDFASTDGLRDWVSANFEDDIKSGYLKYYYTDELPYWHASVAKNTSHLLADNDILVNLDCDNYTGWNGGRFVIRQFIRHGNNMVLHQFRSDYGDGSYGRISVNRIFFNKIGGYDEDFEPMSCQDGNLIRRLVKSGLKYVPASNEKYNDAIQNTKNEGLLYTNSKLTYDEMQHKNTQLAEIKLSKGLLVANSGNWGIRRNIFDIYGQPILIRS